MSGPRVFEDGEDITVLHNIQYGCNGSTLRHALKSLGLPVSGTKRQQARRLVALGLDSRQVNEQYGWRARQATLSPTTGRTAR